ncbi:hypothetical protein ACFU7Y_03095 [Kitasatospora sp. NPDC057542]|uniref:hypothetical protein n=1 Tax=Kitasatospora sp. NPDC057542 TaxID=3346162 RepID=UPI003682D5C9
MDDQAAQLERQVQEQIARLEAQAAAERQLAEQLRQQQGGFAVTVTDFVVCRSYAGGGTPKPPTPPAPPSPTPAGGGR